MKTCSKCKIEKQLTSFSRDRSSKDGLQAKCKDCARTYWDENKERLQIYNNLYRTENSDRIAETRKIYRSRNKESIYAATRKWISENAERHALTSKTYRDKNSENILRRVKEWSESNPDKVKANIRKWKKANPEKLAVGHRTRRARKKSAEGFHTAEDVIDIFTLQKGLCVNCNSKLFNSGRKKYHVDHIVPLARGGSNDKYNLQCLCPSCNLKKNAKDPLAWANENGRLL